jgi:hypothetical protein
MRIITWFEENRILTISATIITVLLIFYISSLSFLGVGGSTSIIAYIYHFTAFAYLSLFFHMALTKGKYSRTLFLIAVLLPILYGISDEFHQSLVPGRDSSIKDILINSIAILITGIAYTKKCKFKL